MGSTEGMDAEIGLVFPPLFGAYGLNGVAAYPGPMTHEVLVQVAALLAEVREHLAKAAALAPEPGMAMCLWAHFANVAIFIPRQHALPHRASPPACPPLPSSAWCSLAC